MTATHDDAGFSQHARLRDGTPVLIRVMQPGDRDRLVAAFAKLDRQSVYTRFFWFKKELSEEDLNRVSTSDFEHSLALAVILGTGADESIIGGASYVARSAPDGARVAEVAFTIEEDYQGQGLAGTLLAALVDIARRHGIARLEADVLASNAAMTGVFQRSGLPLRRRSEGGVVHVELELQGSPREAPAASPPTR